MLQREAGAFLSTATAGQKKKYKNALKKGYSEMQAKRIAKGTLRIK